MRYARQVAREHRPPGSRLQYSPMPLVPTDRWIVEGAPVGRDEQVDGVTISHRDHELDDVLPFRARKSSCGVCRVLLAYLFAVATAT